MYKYTYHTVTYHSSMQYTACCVYIHTHTPGDSVYAEGVRVRSKSRGQLRSEREHVERERKREHAESVWSVREATRHVGKPWDFAVALTMVRCTLSLITILLYTFAHTHTHATSYTLARQASVLTRNI